MKIIIIFICACINYGFSQDDPAEILSVSVDGLLMNEASITASATCGMNGAEKYCRLVDEGLAMMEPGPESNVMCDICDDRNQTKRHPIEYAKSDDKNLWWQSPSMAQGSEYQRVNITIDLKQVYQIVYILLKMADSPRPGTWILERSLDGLTYLPWIFFADTPYACFNLFQRKYPNIKLTTYSRPQSLGDDEVFCTTYYSQPTNFIAGEIIISLINGRQSLLIQDSSAPRSIPLKLINFLSARFIRFRFLKPLTLAADLMTHKGHLEKSIYNRYYYSLRNIEIGGKCICNNHADKCDKDIKNGISVAKCNCKHFTCGNNCEICCPLYNQKPWRQGLTCEECNCNGKANECVYNQTVATNQLSMNKFGQMDGGGTCISCRENTVGNNCEKCQLGYYRPWNVRATESFPCRLCSCNGVGTIGTCISNGEEIGNQKPGDCICKKGYKGSKCDQCDLGYEIQSNNECVSCPCSIDGSVGSSMYRCKPPCNCKVNVEAKTNCHTCKEHYFNLDIKNTEGCQACYCFGITDKCSSLSALNLKVQSLKDWKLTTLTMNKETDPKTTSLLYPIAENALVDTALENPSVYYWSAPSDYLGNWLTSYKSVLQYVIKIEMEPTSTGSQIDSPDVIIKCGSNQISHSISSDDRRMQRKVQIPLKTQHWKLSSVTGSAKESSKDNFLSCLVNVQALFIKGKYYSNQLSIGLLNVTLDRGDPLSAIGNMPHVEKCECPIGFSGLSCESCDNSYRRVDNILVQGRCEKCNCFNHSNSCDAYSGECKNCLHNTSGRYCDTCSPGFYGNPRTEGINACSQCLCPRGDYQLTNMCSTFEPNQYICHECTEKTSGHQCQRCIEGYYGNPLQKIPCRKCQCSDNEENCDSTTGHCRCSFNTMGPRCDMCMHGFFGDALKKSCQSCNCAVFGSNSLFCNKTSGQCQCKPTFSGLTCNTCLPGSYLSNQKCVPCSCDHQGRVSATRYCDSTTGQCLCRSGVTGQLCDRCLPDYFGFPDCKKCECSNHSLSSNCDPLDGSCKCGQNVVGKKCENCPNLFYWSNRTDCSPCQCGLGSSSINCDVNSGQCPCAKHVVGRLCEQCDSNYFGLSPSGCRICPPCSNGRVCNNDGNCVCPSSTEGESCERCADKSWGYNKTIGCKKCDCFPQGSISQTCDVSSGHCLCQPQFQGQKCDACAVNFFGFPNCRPCSCSQDGIMPNQVNICNTITGACSCKTNVEGDKCDTCKNGTFGFDGKYSGGCYPCFCSGQSTKCSLQTDFKLLPNLEYKFHMFNDLNTFVSSKDQRVMELSPRTSPRIYWPFSFYRPVFADITRLLTVPDLSMMYRSIVLIADINCITNNCGREKTRQTEIIMESYDGMMELSYLVNHSQSTNGKIVVELSETSKHGQWYLTKANNKSLTDPFYLGNDNLMNLARDVFLLALLNVSKVKIQLYTSDINPEEIKLNLETFIAVATKENIGASINAVEKCECNNQTKGFHCENPIHGYFKGKIIIPEVFFNISVRVGPRIIMEVKRCACNGHSKICDKFNGDCLNCANNTTGSKCHLCSDGFKGDPRNGGTCTQCECPSREHNYGKKCNSATECECKEGYIGQRCEKCANRFFGNPTRGIECSPCSCNPDGSLSSVCDEYGKCDCASGVMGDKCDQCAANHAVEDKKCKDCLTGCTQELFMRINRLNESIFNMKWKTLPSSSELILQRVNMSIWLIKAKFGDINRFYVVSNEIYEVSSKYQRIKDGVIKKFDDATIVRDAYNKTLMKILDIFVDINETIGGVKGAHVSLEVIKNAANILKDIKEQIQKMSNIESVDKELSMVQNHIDRINKMKKDMQSKLSFSQLGYLKELVNRTKLADSINKDNNEFLKNWTTIILNYDTIMKNYQNIIDEKEKEYQKALLTKASMDPQMVRLKQLIEEFNQKIKTIEDIIRNIKELLKNLTNQTSGSPKLIIPESTKEIVKDIVTRSRDLIKNLVKSFKILSRAEDAKQAYSNISKDILEVEKAINSTDQQLEDSRNQLKIDKFTMNIGDIMNNLSAMIESKKLKETDLQNLNVEYNTLKDKSQRLDEDNRDKLTNIPITNVKVNIIYQNISKIEINQDNNQKIIDNLSRILSSFDIPKSGDTNATDIEQKVNELKAQYNGITKETSSVIVSIKDLRESLKKIRERLNKRKIYTELAHGAAAKSPEPIRLDKNCVRHYKTYFLPKSNAFSLELYLNPQFFTEQNLVLFGYDNTGGVNKSFALTIEKNKKIKFWYDYGTGPQELNIDGAIFSDNKYAGLSISWNLGKWEMKHKSMEEDVESKFGAYSANKSSVNNIFLGPDSHIFLGGFPSDALLKKSNLKLGGQLVDNLRENYRTQYYKGCVYGVTVMNYYLGLQDFHNVEEECVHSKSVEFVLKQKFTCKILQSNTAYVESFRNSIRRHKRNTNTDYNMHFNGHGYVMINTSQLPKSSAQCYIKLNKALRLYTFPQLKINPQSFQFVTAFVNEKMNLGFVLGQRNGKFHHAYWRGDEEGPMKEVTAINDTIVWKVFDKNNDLMFGIDEICDPQSFMYFGGIPLSETKLKDKLIKLKAPYNSYTGSMKIHLVDEEVFRKSSTRFVHKNLKSEKQIIGIPFHSLFVPSDLSEPILLKPDIYEDVLYKGFSINVDFDGIPIKETMTLISIESSQNKVALKVSPDLTFTVFLDGETLSTKPTDSERKWGTYFVVVNLKLKLETTEIIMTVNEPKIKMKAFPVKINAQVKKIELGQVGRQQSFYIYDMFLGERLVNFNSPGAASLPVNVYLKISPSQLYPNVSSNSVSTEMLKTNLRSEDYPLDSGWFDGAAGSMISLRGATINRYTKQSDNKISIRISSYSRRPEMILSINFGPSKTLNLITMEGQALLYDSLTKWNSTLPVSIINKEWHLIELSASSSLDKGLFVKIDDHSFDFPSGPFSFTKPNLIEIGGYSGASPKIYYNGEYHSVAMFTGCLDSLRITDQKVSLKLGTVSTLINQCARVLEFLDTGVEILSSYAVISDPNEIVKLQIGHYNLSGNKNSLMTEFKFKYTGFEHGVLLSTGDGSKFCAITIIDRMLQLSCMIFENGNRKSESIPLTKDKWYKVDFLIFHMENTISLFKVYVGAVEIKIHFSSSEAFSAAFIKPDIYLGSHPSLNSEQRQSLMKTNRNFVGCIAELNVRIYETYIASSFSKSQYLIAGRCSVDKFSYLRNF